MSGNSDLELAAARSKSAQARVVYTLIFGALACLALVVFFVSDSKLQATSEQVEGEPALTESEIRVDAGLDFELAENSRALEQYPVTREQMNAAKFLLGNPVWSVRAEAYLQAVDDGTQTLDQNTLGAEFVNEQAVFERKLNEKLSESYRAVSGKLVSTLIKSLPVNPQCADCLKNWYGLADRLPEFTRAARDYNRAIASMDIVLETEALIALDGLMPGTNFFGDRVLANKIAIMDREKAEILTLLSEAIKQPEVFDFAVFSEKQIGQISTDPELLKLKKQLDLLNRARLRSDFENQFEALAASDNWPGVVQLSKTVNANLVTEKSKTLISTANSVVELQFKIRSLIDNPTRLSDYRVQDYARNLAKESLGFDGFSAELKGLRNKFNQLMTEAQRPLQVTLISDSKAQIFIPRVGIVSPTQQKQIELRPGSYRLIGRCKGALDNEVSLNVDKANLPLVVEVKCGSSLN